MDRRPELLDFTFASADGASTLHGRAAWPAGMGPAADAGTPASALPRPRVVVQVVHGMAEHVERYDELALCLAERGWLVCAHDQIGHGRSADPSRWGSIPSRGGKEALLEDVDRLRAATAARIAPNTPYFLLGHSFGSFVVRAYAARRGAGLAGVVVSGTGYVPPVASAAGRALALAVCRLRGDECRSELLHSMADGAYAKAVEGAESGFEWLSYDEGNVASYIADPACGFMFSAGGYATLCDLTLETCGQACADRVPKSLPLLFVSGADDPVGDCGKGVAKACQLARRAGSTDVSLRLYPGMRHEILKEDGRRLVYHELLDWLEARS